MAQVTAFEHGKKTAAFALNDALRSPELASDIVDMAVKFTFSPMPWVGPSSQVRAGAWFTAVSVVFMAIRMLKDKPPADGLDLDDRIAALGLTGRSAEAVTIAQQCERTEEYTKLMTTVHPPFQDNLSDFLHAALAFARVVLDGHAADDQIGRWYLLNLLLP